MAITDENIDVLLVDDSAIDAELTLHGLRSGDQARRVLWLQDGDVALDYLFRRGRYAGRSDAGPRMVLLDLKMPRVDGIDVLRAIKGDPATSMIPVVIMTSSQEEFDIAKSYDLGANSYIVKPVHLHELMGIAQKTGLYWLSTNRPRIG
ncbi:response regulator [Tahibacter amnicola]|uniref:Response regulator n=1 Tax=Tahibacter amnicola TaxID=2976241 RepID=A0ABY6BA33_9GAMM|nr:response regulator [Tahibacter amnicola]UXI66647.1 response regulator [Tahibacter amnicola]